MKNIGIIAEYNPFHNGHKYHIEKTKENFNNDYTICIMSGNFIQRGLPALYNKWTRTQMAIEAGIDLVIELPTYYAVNNANSFAKHSIDILNNLGCINNISFGTECDNLQDIYDISNILAKEPKEYTQELKGQLDKGITFAKANELALLKILEKPKYAKILNGSNNILGIEYIKALINTKSSIVPFTVKRYDNYNDNTIYSNMCSATAIRQVLENNSHVNLSDVLPSSTYSLMNENVPIFLKNFGTQIIYSLRKMNLDTIRNILEVTEGLETRLKKFSFLTNDIYELIDLVKTKRFTQAKIQRILIHVLLDMTKTEFEQIEKNNLMYIRILGFNSNGKKLLKQISNNTNIPVITSVKKYIDTYGRNPLLEKDILSSNIYCGKYNIDITQKIITY